MWQAALAAQGGQWCHLGNVYIMLVFKSELLIDFIALVTVQMQIKSVLF